MPALGLADRKAARLSMARRILCAGAWLARWPAPGSSAINRSAASAVIADT